MQMVEHLVNNRFQSHDVREVMNIIARKLFRNQRLVARVKELVQSGPDNIAGKRLRT
jgi:hypothetical protein